MTISSTIINSSPLTDEWFRDWETHVKRKVADANAEQISLIFKYARLGAARDFEVSVEARKEVARLLKNISKQIVIGETVK